jgi:hypothetical protein
LNFSLAFNEFVAQRVLDAQINRQLHRLLQAVGGKARAMQIGQTVAVQPLLHAGDALVVDVDQANQMRNLGAGRIDALVLAQEADAGNAELVDVLLLLLARSRASARRIPCASTGDRAPRRCRGRAARRSRARSPRPCR